MGLRIGGDVVDQPRIGGKTVAGLRIDGQIAYLAGPAALAEIGLNRPAGNLWWQGRADIGTSRVERVLYNASGELLVTGATLTQIVADYPTVTVRVSSGTTVVDLARSQIDILSGTTIRWALTADQRTSVAAIPVGNRVTVAFYPTAP